MRDSKGAASIVLRGEYGENFNEGGDIRPEQHIHLYMLCKTHVNSASVPSVP